MQIQMQKSNGLLQNPIPTCSTHLMSTQTAWISHFEVAGPPIFLGSLSLPVCWDKLRHEESEGTR